jgi:hypothetical protein
MAKALPIEELSIEELAPKLAERAIAIHKIAHKPKPKVQKRASSGPNLMKGINSIIVMALAAGPLRAVDLQPKVIAAGFSANSVNSRLESLRNQGVVEQTGEGRWRMKQ